MKQIPILENFEKKNSLSLNSQTVWQTIFRAFKFYSKEHFTFDENLRKKSYKEKDKKKRDSDHQTNL